MDVKLGRAQQLAVRRPIAAVQSKPSDLPMGVIEPLILQRVDLRAPWSR